MTRDPSQETANELFSYTDGQLVRKSTKSVVGCLRPDGYLIVRCAGTSTLVHRIVWIMHNGSIPEGMYIDHINRNRSDNRLSNLRICTSAQNKFNSTIRKDNTSGVKGVCWDVQRNRWKARVSFDGRQYHAGFFKTLDDASIAVKRKRQQLHKQFACHVEHGQEVLN